MRLQFLTFIFLSLVFSGCSVHTGSGRFITKNIDAEIFTEVDISGPYQVEIKKGNNYSVQLETDDNLMKLTDVSVRNKKLVARIDGHSYRNAHFKLVITAPEIQIIKGSASADFDSGELTSKDKIEIRLSSSASFNGNADAPEIELRTSSAGRIGIQGRTRKLLAEASSGSHIDAGNLLSETTTAKASSGSSVSVYASVKLDASASSGGNVQYRGNAAVDQHESSGGNVEKN